VRVEIWSDVICPWCYIGKRRFERALEQFEHRDEVEVVWRSFELDPSAPSEPQPQVERLATKYGVSREEAGQMNARVTGLAAELGLDYHLDKALSGSTFEAHQLLQLARANGVQDALKEALLHAYFVDGVAISDRDALVHVAASVGLDPAEARTALEDGRFIDSVRGDEELASQLGATGVPFFVLDRRYGVVGAQPPEALLGALERAWEAEQAVAS
jgi:predicted DsbA family dithiol-disulfide isomerase